MAVSLILTGDTKQKATARKALTNFLKTETAREVSEPVEVTEEDKNPDRLEWWPSILPPKAGEAPEASYPQPIDGWVCFHCGKRMVTYEDAREHFGATSYSAPACLIESGKGIGLLNKLQAVESERDYLVSMLDTIKIIDSNTFTNIPPK